MKLQVKLLILLRPKQVGEILFDKLGIKGGKKTATGQYSNVKCS
ncbi:hypothetical protein ABVN80_05270 [Acinetobacter baumannii]